MKCYLRKQDRAELQNSYISLLISEVLLSYPDIGSGKNWDPIQETFQLGVWQERCKALLADNLRDAGNRKALRES